MNFLQFLKDSSIKIKTHERLKKKKRKKTAGLGFVIMNTYLFNLLCVSRFSTVDGYSRSFFLIFFFDGCISKLRLTTSFLQGAERQSR